MYSKYLWYTYFLLICNINLCQMVTANFYKTAVVEYNPSTNSIEDYLKILSETEEVDLIVFPEYTLGGNATLVPDGSTQTIPCNSSEDFEYYLKQLSCAAAQRKSYLVVNLKEKAICNTETQASIGDKRPCSSSGYNLYNTNVAFDRNGAVVSRYRKYNLFGEFSLNTTLTPDISTFTTDFNVTFGLFTCFDILFETPALALTRQNVDNIIFPTMWFSELPFLTALQAQQMFSVATNVNFLSSGANSPVRGSGGTGIFQGVHGPVIYDYVETGGTKVYIAEVGNSPNVLPEVNTVDYFNLSEEEIDVHAKAMDDFTLIRDQVDVYSNTLLGTDTENTVETLCHEEFCCYFNITISVNDSLLTTEDYYHYRLVAYTGVRSFSGMYNGGVNICGIIFCKNATHLESCAERFSNYSTISWPITFEHIEITANFTNVHTTQQYPNSLLSHVRPIFPNATVWSETEYKEQEILERSFVLNAPQNRLLTFAIYGRDFAKDSDPSANDSPKKIASLGLAGSLWMAIIFLRKW